MRNRGIIGDENGEKKQKAGWVMHGFFGHGQDWSKGLMWFGQKNHSGYFVENSPQSWGVCVGGSVGDRSREIS